MAERRPTATSNFGVSWREGHDASAFYARFGAPEISNDDVVASPATVSDPFRCADARSMAGLADSSVALVVTSPPYFAGKQYEEDLDRENVPSSYLEYLTLLREVFAECCRVLEPGGRIAVNVANLGRRPFRSLAADVTAILQDDLHLLLRGEIVWKKGDGASGSCAWGSYRSPVNPVLRDLTERVVIASKGRFDRAKSTRERERLGLPFSGTLSSDEFMAATLDLWEIPAEQARRVEHPAPFPVELPERLIHLYTYRDDLVLDPFMGSGSTLVAAARADRRYVGYDLDPDYVEIAKRRVAEELLAGAGSVDVLSLAANEAKPIRMIAERLLQRSGFTIIGRDLRLQGLPVDLVASDANGMRWHFSICGGFTTTRVGLNRTETAWAEVGRAFALAALGEVPLVVLTSHLPRPASGAEVALRSGASAIHDVIEILADDALGRLAEFAAHGSGHSPAKSYYANVQQRARTPKTLPGAHR